MSAASEKPIRPSIKQFSPNALVVRQTKHRKPKIVFVLPGAWPFRFIVPLLYPQDSSSISHFYKFGKSRLIYIIFTVKFSNELRKVIKLPQPLKSVAALPCDRNLSVQLYLMLLYSTNNLLGGGVCFIKFLFVYFFS